MRLILLLTTFLQVFFANTEPNISSNNVVTQLNLLRIQRIELIKNLKEKGLIETEADLKQFLNQENKHNIDSVNLSNINKQIKSLRQKELESSLDYIENSNILGLAYRENQAKIEKYKRTYQNALEAGVNKADLASLNLAKKRAYLEKNELQLKHQLLSDKTFTSLDQLNQNTKQKHKDPRVQALAEIQTELESSQIAQEEQHNNKNLEQEYLNPRAPLNSSNSPNLGQRGIISDSISAEISPIANEIKDGINTSSLQEYVNSVKNIGSKVTDKVLAGSGDEATGRDGYEVRRDSLVISLKEKISSLNNDIIAAKTSGNNKKAQSLEALKASLEGELNKAQISPQGIKLQSEITSLKSQLDSLSGSSDQELVKALKEQIKTKETQYEELKANPKATAKNYIRDGLHFAVISATTQGVLNIIDQVKNGEEVDLGTAFDFITTPDFLLGTSGAFAGGLLVQKALTTGFGKIAMATVQNAVPGPLKFIVQALPYTIGAMVGSDLMTGNLGRHSLVDMAFSGIGSSVGMMLGSAIFPPIGSIAGSVLGGMLGDNLAKMIQGKDSLEMEIDLRYSPNWLEIDTPAWESQDKSDFSLALHGSSNILAAETIKDLQDARTEAYNAYLEANQANAPLDVQTRAYKLYEELNSKISQLK